MERRDFLKLCTAAAIIPSVVNLEEVFAQAAATVTPTSITDVKPGEDVFAYITRVKGGFDQTLYRQVIGAANAFKEGDQAIGVGADNDKTRQNARILLNNTKIKDLHEHPLLADDLQKLIWKTTDQAKYEKIKDRTMGQLKDFLLTRSEKEIKEIMPGLDSETIGCVPKLMSNEELIKFDQKIYNPLPGTKIGAKGYLSARIQPNSPTDNPDDIMWEVFDAFSYATGDIVIGTNPVDSQVESVARVEKALKDVVETFKLRDVVPWCVLSHIDVQAEVEKKYPGTVETMFQSLAGTDDCNKTFDVTVAKIMNYATSKKGKRYGLYFETGQGSEFTNGAANGVDMMVLESRKYGFSRAAKMELARVQPKGAWLHVNDVAGFIGPEVFRTREQLVRCCLEDICMGKLHGLTIGLDICSTLHMAVSLDDLAWCQDQIMPAAPAYLMALPTRNDPMLSYLTTMFQDHVRLRKKFDLKVNDAMWAFYKRIGIVDGSNRYTSHYGDPLWVYYQYRLAKGDKRSREMIYAEGKNKLKEVGSRGVDIAVGHGKNIWDLNPKLEENVTTLYKDAKKCLWDELTPAFIATIPNVVEVRTQSKDRENYIAQPATGEKLNSKSVAVIEQLRDSSKGKEKQPNGYIIISDGLNADAIMDKGHLMPYLQEVRKLLTENGAVLSDKNIVVINGRVRAGYEIGNILFEKSDPNRLYGIIHIIGERPGTMHHSYSAYISVAKGSVWTAKKMDHDMTKLVCNIAETALDPKEAAKETLSIVREIRAKLVGTSRSESR
ncbi:MAG TPA: ethanolamine ammonia-lyase subunit EutB [Geobacteraceae bacterium]|nr:ethanolamine ammonia-lyase subunit EutB [Geobacteraceae bacterium]